VPGPAAAIAGSRAQGVDAKRLAAAAAALAGVEGAPALKIRAGEHLAGLVLTAFNGPPVSVDTDGGPDFVFERQRYPRWGWTLGDADVAAVEVKSLPGSYRRHEASEAIGDGFEALVRPVAELLIDCSPLILQAAGALEAKTPRGWSRHAFVVAHLFDGFPAEAFELDGMLLAHRLPALSPTVGLDTLWVLFHPVAAAFWAATDCRWTSLLFSVSPADGPPPTDGPDLQQAEEIFLEAIGHRRGSPWMFELTADTDP
jgi:hypothetical protein